MTSKPIHSLVAVAIATFLSFVTADARAGEKAFDCAVTQLRVNSDRFFVRCAESRPGMSIPPFVRDIPYYSVPYTQQNTRYLLDLVLAARDSGKPLRLIFEEDPEMNPPGCARNNCRRMIAAGLAF